jgi:hypothetical protein
MVFTVVRSSNHQYPIIVLQAIYFIEEVASVVGPNDSIDIFHDDKTGGHLPGFHKHSADVEGVAHGFDI